MRNAQSKRLHATFIHSMRFEILILCAYLRWVTKTKQSPDGGCFVLRRRREIRTQFGRLAACVTRNQKGFTPLLSTQCGLKSLSYAHISGGSPKQNSLPCGGCFVLRRRREIRTGFGRLATCVTHLKSNNFFAKSDTCTKQLLFTAFYRIYTFRVLHTLVNFATLIVYYRQSTPRAANARDFLYHSKNTANSYEFATDPRKQYAKSVLSALPSPARIPQRKSTAVAVRFGAPSGIRKEQSDGIAIVACGNNDSGGETCVQSIKRCAGTGGGRNVTKRANRVSRRVRRRKPRANVAQSPETKKKHRGCGAFWCALRDSNPGPTD